MNKHLFTRAFLLVTAVCTVLFFVGCDGDNSVSPSRDNSITPSTNLFAGNWNLAFSDSSVSCGDGPIVFCGKGTITIASNGRFRSEDVFGYFRSAFGGTTYTVDGTVSISGALTGRIVATVTGGQAGSFTGNLSANSGSGVWGFRSGDPSGTWSASRR